MNSVLNMRKVYKQRFRDCWVFEDRYCNWLTKIEGDDSKCFCRLCYTTLIAKLSSIDKHRQTAKHKNCEDAFLKSRKGNRNDSGNVYIQQCDYDEELSSEVNPEALGEEMLRNKVVKSEATSSNGSTFYAGSAEQEATKSTILKSTTWKFKPKSEEHPYRSFRMHQHHHQQQQQQHKPKIVTYKQERIDDECDYFCRSLAAQMKKLPEKYMIQVQLDIQNVMAKTRLEVLDNSFRTNDSEESLSTLESNSAGNEYANGLSIPEIE